MAAYGTWEAVQSLDAGLATAFGGGHAYGYKSFAIGGLHNMAYLGMAGYFGQTIASNHFAVAMGAKSKAPAINSVALNGTQLHRQPHATIFLRRQFLEHTDGPAGRGRPAQRALD